MSCAFFRSLTTAARATSCACPGKTAFSAPHRAPPGEVSYVAPSTPATSNTANPPATAVLPLREWGMSLRHRDAGSTDCMSFSRTGGGLRAVMPTSSTTTGGRGRVDRDHAISDAQMLVGSGRYAYLPLLLSTTKLYVFPGRTPSLPAGFSSSHSSRIETHRKQSAWPTPEPNTFNPARHVN